MKKLASLLFLTVLVSLTVASRAESERVSIPLKAEDKSVKISGLRDIKVEDMEGGGIRLSFRNDKEHRGHITLEYTFPEPLRLSAMGFELRQAETERLVGTAVIDKGKELKKVFESMGPELFPYVFDFLAVASENEMDLEEPIKKVIISFRVAAQSGDRFVELKNWWVE